MRGYAGFFSHLKNNSMNYDEQYAEAEQREREMEAHFDCKRHEAELEGDESITINDIESCWQPYAMSYFCDILNKKYPLDNAIADLRSLIGGKHDPRI